MSSCPICLVGFSLFRHLANLSASSVFAKGHYFSYEKPPYDAKARAIPGDRLHLVIGIRAVECESINLLIMGLLSPYHP